MKQYLVRQICRQNLSLTLEGEEFHYLCHVRRHKKDQSLIIRDSQGKSFHALLSDIRDTNCTILVGEECEMSEKEYSLSLLCCLPKGKKLDSIIRQATEAGVQNIIPLYSDHSLIRYKGDDFDKKRVRWDKIIREALQQSGSSVPTTLSHPLHIPELPDLAENEAGYYCHQEYIKENSLSSLFQNNKDSINIVIGPEGGLSATEIKALDEKGYKPFYLGGNILRTETAALFAISAVITVMELI